MKRTRSLGLTSGIQVKVLDVGLGIRKIRILGVIEDGKLVSIPDSNRECWTVRESLR